MTTPTATHYKSKSPDDRTLKTGDLIYWDGDAANPPHLFLVLSVHGGIARVRDVCGSTNCADHGREQSLPVVLVYSFRWGWQDERNAARRAMLEEMRRNLAARRATE